MRFKRTLNTLNMQYIYVLKLLLLCIENTFLNVFKMHLNSVKTAFMYKD